MRAIILVAMFLLGGCAGWQTQVKDQSSALTNCMSACAASCMIESAKNLLVCPVPKNESK